MTSWQRALSVLSLLLILGFFVFLGVLTLSTIFGIW